MSTILKQIPDLTVDVRVPDATEARITRTLSIGNQSYKSLIDKTESVIPSETGSGMILIIDNTGVIQTGTDKFMVQQVSEQFEEKVQVSETLQEDTPALFMFGSKTVPCSFALKMLDTASANKGIRGEWYKGFQLFWETKLRASKLFKEKQTAVMLIDNEAIFGYPISMSLSKNSQEEFMGTITLNWLVLDRQTLFNDPGSLANYMDILNRENTWLLENNSLIDSLLNFLKAFSLFDSTEGKSLPINLLRDFEGNPVPTTSKFKGNQLQLMYERNISFLNQGVRVPLVVQDKSGGYTVSPVLSKGNLSMDRVKKFLTELSEITGDSDLSSEFGSCPQIYDLYNSSGTWSDSETTVQDILDKIKISISNAITLTGSKHGA